MPLRFQHPSLLGPASLRKVRSYRTMRSPKSPYKRGTGLTHSVLDMSCDCSDQQTQRIECDYCNPQSCVCVEGEPDICIFCEREFIYLQSDNDRGSVISNEDCSSIASRARAHSCIQSPEQHNSLSAAFSDSISLMHSGPDALICREPAPDFGEGPSGIQGNVSRSCTNQSGLHSGGRTSTPNNIQRQLKTNEDSHHRHHEVYGIDSDEDSHPKQRGKRSRSVSKRRETSEVPGRRDSWSISSTSSVSSGSDRSSSSSSGGSSIQGEKRMVHADGGKSTPTPGKHSKNQGRTEPECTPNPSKKIKPLSSHPKDKEGQRKSVYYWSYYKCPPATTDTDGPGRNMGGRPGVDPDSKRLRGASRTPRFILADHTGTEVCADVLRSCKQLQSK